VNRPTLGLRANLAQFSLLVGLTALVGGMVGQERTVLPLLAVEVFGLTSFTAILTFLTAFGLVKAATNFFAGTLSDRWGRKPMLVAGWLVGLPVPLLLIWAPTWGWVILANVFLGLSQGLTWSTAVIMKIDLAGPRRRGLAAGLNEASGYGAVALTAWATGLLASRYGLRPEPFYLGLAYAGLGLGLSALVVRETRDHAHSEDAGGVASIGKVLVTTTFGDRALSAASQAGLVNNLNDAVAWGLPLLFIRGDLSTGTIGLLVALYPAVWATGQLLTGPLSDRLGRKPLVVWGMSVQAVGLGWVAASQTFAPWVLGSVLLGAGTALVYPTLLAAVGDVAHPRWRASALGVYRFWRDLGFAAGGLLIGVAADLMGLRAAVWVAAALTAASGLVVLVRMYETRPLAAV
jgi:MFS family permease